MSVRLLGCLEEASVTSMQVVEVGHLRLRLDVGVTPSGCQALFFGPGQAQIRSRRPHVVHSLKFLLSYVLLS